MTISKDVYFYIFTSVFYFCFWIYHKNFKANKPRYTWANWIEINNFVSPREQDLRLTVLDICVAITFSLINAIHWDGCDEWSAVKDNFKMETRIMNRRSRMATAATSNLSLLNKQAFFKMFYFKGRVTSQSRELMRSDTHWIKHNSYLCETFSETNIFIKNWCIQNVRNIFINIFEKHEYVILP